MDRFVLAIDQGTTSTRAMLFREDLSVAAVSQEQFPQHFPHSGWVEHDPEDLWTTAVATCKRAIAMAGAGPRQIAAIGIANQRETAIVWDRASGRPIYNAIVWQDRRTADFCTRLKSEGHEPAVSAITGLLLDPYFSATKIAWLLDHISGARQAAADGRLAFGTVDSFLLWRLTGGQVHATDATNASRTLLYDIEGLRWHSDLTGLFEIPPGMLPDVRDSSTQFGVCDPAIFGAAIPVMAMAGDQQAAAIGQACFSPGMVKSTYGTGCFAVLNTGTEIVRSRNRLLTTIACRLKGKTAYALEGSIFVAGAAVQWLRDGLGIVTSAAETGKLAEAADPSQAVYLVPAFVGLGAPYWDADCRGAMFGLTRATGSNEFARAALESVCYQTRDLIEAMREDWTAPHETVLRVDGGMAASDWTMQRLADLLGAPVDRPKVLETTALGAAYLAGLEAGVYPDPEGFSKTWALERRFEPHMPEAGRARMYAGWKDAVARTLTARHS
jgi:glycerol kinase